MNEIKKGLLCHGLDHGAAVCLSKKIMHSEEIKELMASTLFNYMKAEDISVLDSCFDIQYLRIKSGSAWNTAEHFAYLVSGEGTLKGDGLHDIANDSVFGIRIDEHRGCIAAEECFTARTDSVIVYADMEILRKVCYMACWFHGRFVTEVLNRSGSLIPTTAAAGSSGSARQAAGAQTR